jgi:hypothetical protein
VSALETYLGCPFKFFAQHMLRLDEEPDDEEIMDPRRQGQLLHDVFEAFFAQWQKAGRARLPGNLDDARTMFTAAVDHILEGCRTRKRGSRGRGFSDRLLRRLGEAVLRMEAGASRGRGRAVFWSTGSTARSRLPPPPARASSPFAARPIGWICSRMARSG